MTDRPRGSFTPPQYQALIRRDADALLAALASADEAATVVGCPEWSVGDLVVHLGKVHVWAAGNTQRAPGADRTGYPVIEPEGGDLAGWYAECVSHLLQTLAATDPDQPCWAFQPGNEVAGFWSRRQSHETAMHRNDLVATLGQKYDYEPAHAADGIGEVLDVFLSRRRAYGAPPLDVPVPVLVDCSDRPERWLLVPVEGRPEEHRVAGPVLTEAEVDSAAAVLRGPAAGLLFTLWKRQDAATAGITCEGDTDLADRLLAARLTP